VDPVAEDPPGYDEGRPDRERSVRATAPPPSPTEKRGELVGQGDELSRAQSPYGPREEAATNTLALMPTSMDASHPHSTTEALLINREHPRERKKRRIWKRRLPTL
jgi:hypothetical protein